MTNVNVEIRIVCDVTFDRTTMGDALCNDVSLCYFSARNLC